MKDKFNHVLPKGLSKAFHFFQMKEYIVLSEGAQGAHAALNAIYVERSKTMLLKFMFADQGAKRDRENCRSRCKKKQIQLLKSKVININY